MTTLKPFIINTGTPIGDDLFKTLFELRRTKTLIRFEMNTCTMETIKREYCNHGKPKTEMSMMLGYPVIINEKIEDGKVKPIYKED